MTSKLQVVLEKILNGERLTSVDLSNEGLDEFPTELLALVDCLEVLNMGGNNLSCLPQDFALFSKLRIIFFAQNRFTEIPKLLGSMGSLFMVSFKSNKVLSVAPESLSPSISWLILTDNEIEELPTTIGHLKTLRKLMLAGNKLQSLPVELSNCVELELLRIAANRLTSLPDWIFDLPRLTWFAYAGNPLDEQSDLLSNDILTQIPFSEIEIGECVGEGASGYVHKAIWTRPGDESVQVAVKLFKGETTSDGLPVHEMETTEAIGEHGHFISVLGRLSDAPHNQLGLVLPLLDTSKSAYRILGNPPSFDTITRDTFPAGTSFNTSFVRSVLQGIASAGHHLHSAETRGRGIIHGDLYAHNILVHHESLHPLLTDLGAASFKTSFTAAQCERLEQIEVRAFGCLVDDLLQHYNADNSEIGPPSLVSDFRNTLQVLRQQCWETTVSARPTFSTIVASLQEV